MSKTVYKVVELTTVTDEEQERVINEWVDQDWVLDTIQFAMRDASKRPAMAFRQIPDISCWKTKQKVIRIRRCIAKFLPLNINVVI